MTPKAAPGSAFATRNRSPTRDWQARAVCRGQDPELFFPHRGVGRGADRRYREDVRWIRETFCERCSVIDDCLAYAVALDNRFGVWGGLGEDDRPHGGQA